MACVGDRRQQRATIPIAAHGMNKLEESYAVHLTLLANAGEIKGYLYESIKFRLADGAWYMPDFTVWMPDGSLEVHEVKGHWREAAKVRIKVAAERFPMYRFISVQRKGVAWVFEGFSRHI